LAGGAGKSCAVATKRIIPNIDYFYQFKSTTIMLSNYLKIALRSLSRQKSYSAINIIGLAVGMACCLVLALFIREELRFDADVPQNDRVYRINPTIDRKDAGSVSTMAATQFPLAPTLKAEMPEIEQAIRLNANGRALLANGANKFLEKQVMYADDGFFQMFPSEFIAGNPATALKTPQSIVLTEDLAKKYFGNEPALGKTLRVDNSEYFTVTGVIKNLPNNRHVRFDALIPIEFLIGQWQKSGVEMRQMWFAFTEQHTYIKVREGSSLAALKAKFPSFVEKHLGNTLKRVNISFTLDLQPLREIHLNPVEGEIQPQGSMQTLRIVGGIALVILLLACINFMNLSTARSTRRAREVGMRKVFGAARSQLMMQFLSESVVISLIALALALVLVEAALPLVNSVMETHLSVGYIANSAQILVFVSFALLVGVLAGTYPALVLSGFAPVKVLKGAFVRTSTGATLRKGLVIMQFAVSIILVAGTIVILKQLDFTQSKDLGFKKEQVLTLSLPNDSLFEPRKASMKAALRQVSGVMSVAGADLVPGDAGTSENPVTLEGAPLDKNVLVSRFVVDEDYVQTMGMMLAEGRNFEPVRGSDANGAFLLNEAAANALGIGKQANVNDGKRIGTRLEWYGAQPSRKGELIGIVKDFHFQSLHSKIAPAIFMINNSEVRRFVVRMNTSDVRGTMAQIERVWNDFAPNWVFDYSFVDENFNKLYKTEVRTSRIVTVFASLAVFIACLGLFGLAAFSAEVRTKEIGIRKVLGATEAGIIGLLSKDFLALVGIAIILATPLSYWATSRWLQDFEYKTELSWWIFAVAGLSAVGIAFITVAGQALRAAGANPVQSLRSE
jgi:putative ABC transport system permease protein